MPLLRAFADQRIIPALPHFTLNEKRLEECKITTGYNFNQNFLNKKEKPVLAMCFQLYYLERLAEIDGVRTLLGDKFRIPVAAFHFLLQFQCLGQDGWLPTHDPNLTLVLFMESKDGTNKLVDITYWEDDQWGGEIYEDDELPAGTIIIAQANAPL